MAQVCGSSSSPTIISCYRDPVEEAKVRDFTQLEGRKRALNHMLVDIENIANRALRELDNSIYQESWDGFTNDCSFFGAWSDHTSRMANIKTSQVINDLSYQIQKFNNELESYQMHIHCARVPVRLMDDLRGASDSILYAEMNESNPMYTFAGQFGDYMASRNTQNVLEGVKQRVYTILSDVRSHKMSLQ